MKLIANTDKEGVALLLEAMKDNPRYDVTMKSDLQYSKYQIAIIPISLGVSINDFYQTQWDRVCVDDIDPPYYVMPLLSGVRLQIHVSDEVKMFCSNGKSIKGGGLFSAAKSLMDNSDNSIYEAVWREKENVCYITDVIMTDGVAMVNEPYINRYKIINDKSFDTPVRAIPIEVIKTRGDLDSFISDKGSAVIREGMSSIKVSVYQLEDEDGRVKGV